MISLKSSNLKSLGIAIASKKPKGSAPMAARSLTLTVTALNPMSKYVMFFGKCLDWISMSQVEIKFVSLKLVIAVSSGVISLELEIIYLTSSFSPMSETFKVMNISINFKINKFLEKK